MMDGVLTDSWLVGLRSDLTTMNSRSLSLTAGCGAMQAAALGRVQKADLTGFFVLYVVQE